MATVRDHETWHDPAIASACKQHWATPAEIAAHQNFAEILCMRINTGDSLLDAGCGTGLLYGNLKSLTQVSYLGIDIAQPMLDIARRDYPDGEFCKGDIYNLAEFESGSFDVVACAAVLGHLPAIQIALAEMMRVCRRTLVFTVWPAPSGVIEGTEVLIGRTALHRAYSDEYIRSIVRQIDSRIIINSTVIGIERIYNISFPK